MFAAIRNVSCHLPSRALSNDELATLAEQWTAKKILDKTGIRERRIALPAECASDLAFSAADKLLTVAKIERSKIDYVIFCTQMPDFPLPTTACLLQDRLGLSTSCGAVDINLGCSGYVYGLGLAQGLIETNQARHVLLLTGETYSKALEEADLSVRTLFGDAGSATLIDGVAAADRLIGPYVYGTDGRGGPNLILKRNSWRCAEEEPAQVCNGREKTTTLTMNGPEIFSFTLNAVPKAIKTLLVRAERKIEDIDLFVFHQANEYMLTHLRKKIGIPEEKFVVAMEYVGNTVSTTIPYALEAVIKDGRLVAGNLVMLVGFGVGYSWGATLVRWV